MSTVFRVRKYLIFQVSPTVIAPVALWKWQLCNFGNSGIELSCVFRNKNTTSIVFHYSVSVSNAKPQRTNAKPSFQTNHNGLFSWQKHNTEFFCDEWSKWQMLAEAGRRGEHDYWIWWEMTAILTKSLPYCKSFPHHLHYITRRRERHFLHIQAGT